MEGGEKMRRFLKKLSLLCLVLFLCASTFLGLSANAALEDISLEGLSAQEVADTVKRCQGWYLYIEIENCFYDLLVANGEKKLAEEYERHRLEFFESLNWSEVYNGDEAFFEMATNFFKNKFKPHPLDTAAVGIYALIYRKSYEVAEKELIQYFKPFGRRRAISL